MNTHPATPAPAPIPSASVTTEHIPICVGDHETAIGHLCLRAPYQLSIIDHPQLYTLVPIIGRHFGQSHNRILRYELVDPFGKPMPVEEKNEPQPATRLDNAFNAALGDTSVRTTLSNSRGEEVGHLSLTNDAFEDLLAKPGDWRLHRLDRGYSIIPLESPASKAICPPHPSSPSRRSPSSGSTSAATTTPAPPTPPRPNSTSASPKSSPSPSACSPSPSRKPPKPPVRPSPIFHLPSSSPPHAKPHHPHPPFPLLIP